MKRAIYLTTLLFSLVLISACCEKDDTTPDVKTLEQLNPDWSSLTWNKTTLHLQTASITNNPETLSFTIVGNVITRYLNGSPATYTDIKFNGNIVTFTPSTTTGGDPLQYKWQKVGSQIILNDYNSFAPSTPGVYDFYLDI